MTTFEDFEDVENDDDDDEGSIHIQTITQSPSATTPSDPEPGKTYTQEEVDSLLTESRQQVHARYESILADAITAGTLAIIKSDLPLDDAAICMQDRSPFKPEHLEQYAPKTSQTTESPKPEPIFGRRLN